MRKNEVEIAKLQRCGGRWGGGRGWLINRAKGSRGREHNGLGGRGPGTTRGRDVEGTSTERKRERGPVHSMHRVEGTA